MRKIVELTLALYLFFAIFQFSGCGKEENKNSDSSLTQSVNIYLVALEGSQLSGKMIGCNDILVAEQKNVKVDKSLLEAALNELIAAKDKGVLLNFIKGPALLLIQVSIAGGIADVYLKGDFAISGACDIPRIQEQLSETVNQFTEYKKINIYINNQTLEEYLSVAKASF